MSELIPIFDGHNDALMKFAPPYNAPLEHFFTREPGFQFDFPRAREGGMVGGIFAIFIEDDAAANLINHFDPSKDYVMPALEWSVANRAALTMMRALFRLERMSDGALKVVRSVAELEACIQAGVFAAVLHLEGAEPIDENLDALEVYYQAGLRSLGPVWSRPTIFGEGVPFKFPHSPDTGPGLTDTGKALVRMCNELGIMIDLSHLNEKGFWDVARLSTAPLVATHSNAWNLCRLPRNLLDNQLDAIKESGGIAGLNMVTALAREDAADNADTPVEVFARQLDYLAERMGIDHVAIGADFGMSMVATEMNDVSTYPKLIDCLRGMGYDEASLRKIGYENWLRVLRQTWKA
jgi:membrane dipeptidase